MARKVASIRRTFSSLCSKANFVIPTGFPVASIRRTFSTLCCRGPKKHHSINGLPCGFREPPFLSRIAARPTIAHQCYLHRNDPVSRSANLSRFCRSLEFRSNSLTSIYAACPARKAISASSRSLPKRDRLMAVLWSRLISRPHPSQLNFSFSVAGFR